MSDLARAVLLLSAAVNPPRLAGLTSRLGRAPVAGGAALGGAVLTVLAVASGPLLDGLEISEPTLRVAAGLVAAAAGLWHLVGPAPSPWDVGPGRGASLAPVAFPVLLRPEVVLSALSTGAQDGVWVAVLASTVALALGGLALVRPADSRVVRAAGRLVGALLVVLGVALVVGGVLAV